MKNILLKKQKNSSEKNKSTKKSFRIGFLVGIVFFIFFIGTINFTIQIFKNPSQIVGFLGVGEPKTLNQTWLSYKNLFHSHATNIITPEYLSALAQAESAGNPWAVQDWNINWTTQWDRFFSPRSSSVGLYQFTTPTFERAKKYCIHNGRVRKRGLWYDVNSCWFNGLYTRFIPTHSIELASSYLDIQVRKLKAKYLKNKKVSLKNLKRLASVIHLCGEKKAKKFLKNSFHFSGINKCGAHSLKSYVLKIESMERELIH